MFSLRDVQDWHAGVFCTPTALAAVSGLSPAKVGELLSRSAAVHNETIGVELRRDYNINHWLTAISLLGGGWREVQNFSAIAFVQRPTIAEWLASRPRKATYLVHCDVDGTKGHVFATDGYDVVDTYTEGRRVKVDMPPPDFSDMRIKHVFEIAGSFA